MGALASPQGHSAAGHHHGAGMHTAAPKPFARLLQILRPERRDVGAVALFALAVAILSLATPIAVEALVNTVAFGILMWPVLVLAGVLLACLSLAAAIRAMQVYIVEGLKQRLFVRVVADYAYRLPRLRMEAFDSQYGPELTNRFFDVLNVQKSLAKLLLDGLALIVTTIVGMVVLAFYHPYLLGFDLLLFALIVFLLFVLGWGGVRTSLEESHAKYDVAAWLEEQLRCLRALKFAGGPHLALEKADHLVDTYVTARRRHFRVVWRQTLFALGLQVMASSVLLGLGGWLVIDRQLTLGQLVAAELIVSLVVASVAKLGKYTETFYDLLAGAEKLGLLTDLPMERAGGEPLQRTDRGIGIRLRGLQQISDRDLPVPTDWQIAANEKVAIIGPPGSGKTTLFEALCGLREVTHGIVELDGIDLRSLALDSVRDQVTLVGGPEIFLGTVAENIRVGRRHLSEEQIRAALRAVNLLSVVHELPHGFNTPLTPDGRPFSASQALRLTLARALVDRPRLLILDGVLDALDLRKCPDLLACLFDRAAPWTLLLTTTNPALADLCGRRILLAPLESPSSLSPSAEGAQA